MLRDVGIALALGLVAALSMLPYWGGPTDWGPDALFYEAQRQEVLGAPREEARTTVFASAIADPLKAREAHLPPAEQRIANGEWVEYSSDFYRRRWAVPAAAAAVDPLFGIDSLEVVSLLGYVAIAVLLYLLLRRRFGTAVSAAVTLACLALPPLRNNSATAGTDSWGVALLIAGLLSAVLTLERGRRWLIPWALTVLALSFTRDLTVVLVLAAGWVALRERSRDAIALAATGLVAAIPAPLLAGAPFRDNLAYVIDGFHAPTDTSWSYIAAHYPAKLAETIRYDLAYPLEFAFPPPMILAGLLTLAGVATLLARPSHGDRYVTLMRAALLAGAATILISINYGQLRLELAMLPPVAVGVAMLAQLLEERLRNRDRGQGRRREHAAEDRVPVAALD